MSDAFWIAMFNFLAFIVVILRQERQASKLESVERSTNGLVDKIIRTTTAASHAEGLAQGRAEKSTPPTGG